MRRDHHVVDAPERARRIERLRSRTRRGWRRRGRRARSAATMSASTCSPPRPALISTGMPERAVAGELSRTAASQGCRASPAVSGSRQTRMSVRVRNGVEPVRPGEALDAGHRRRRAGSSRRPESRAAASAFADAAPEHAHAHDADAHLVRRRLRPVPATRRSRCCRS